MLTVSIKTYKKIKEKLTNTAKDFFHLLSELGKLKKQNNEIKKLLCQTINFKNLRQTRVEYFNPDSDSKILNEEFLKTAITATTTKNSNNIA